MSASTYWAPPSKGRALNVTSSFLDKISEVRDESPASGRMTLTGEDVIMLKALRVMDKSLKEPIQQLLDALAQFDTIEVWREY